jgi:hypothetical protein
MCSYLAAYDPDFCHAFDPEPILDDAGQHDPAILDNDVTPQTRTPG